MITAIGFVETGETAVGDALHEGYSDYLAASYVSDEAGRDVTLVGEYALQNCEDLQRELSIPKVYEEGDAVTDAHTSGLTWASALWTLRTELGTATADLLVVKSLFFLSTAPGFVEAIDALIRADEALNNGVNARRIREILFDELKFVGSADYLENGIVDVGLRGCATVPYPRVSSHWLLALFFLWLSITILLGRRKSP